MARRAALALGAGRGVYAWWPTSMAPGDARVESFTFDADALGTGDDTALAAALVAVRRADADARELHVALTSPWCSPREVALPPMREHEVRTVLVRDAARYFPVLRTARVVATRALRPGAWFASDADGAVLDAISTAAHAAGFHSVRFVPAVGAWAHAAANTTGRVFVVDDEAAVLDARAGLLTRLRRCRVADIGAQGARADDALPLAARHAPWCTERELVSAAAQSVRTARAQRVTRRLIIACAAALAAAVALQSWGAQRHVARIEAQRVDARPTMVPLLAARDSLALVTDALAEMSRAAGRTPSWSNRLWALSSVLPADAQFTSWRGEGDSVVVEGRADDVAAVIAKLHTGTGVDAVRSIAPITDGGAEGASFSVRVRFRAGGTP